MANLVRELAFVLEAEPIDIGRAALVIARVEYPDLDPAPHLDTLDRIGAEARTRAGRISGASVRARAAMLNTLIFEDERFAGNQAHYGDFRNSLLNLVLERRLGIPITLALVYMEVARRAGIDVRGVSFPGHFLMRMDGDDEVVLDPFDGGAELDKAACRRLLARHLGAANEDTPFDAGLLRPCSARQMILRIINNLKRTYVDMGSFPQARLATDLLLCVDPMMLSELRDRGLLSYRLEDFPAALRDLEDYLRLRAWKDDVDQEERDQILEHVKTLRRRVAGMN